MKIFWKNKALIFIADKLNCENILKEQGPNIYTLIKRIKDNELKDFFDKGYITVSKF